MPWYVGNKVLPPLAALPPYIEELHCTCSRAEVDFPFQNFYRHFVLLLPNTALLYQAITLLFLQFPGSQQQVDFIINCPFGVSYSYIQLQIPPKFLCVGHSCSRGFQYKRCIKTMPKFRGLGGLAEFWGIFHESEVHGQVFYWRHYCKLYTANYYIYCKLYIT